MTSADMGCTLIKSCIVSGVHDDYDSPPNTTQTPKRVHHESFSDVIGGATVAIVRALSDSKKKEAIEIPQRIGTLHGPWNFSQ